jgi:hypothetical protein
MKVEGAGGWKCLLGLFGLFGLSLLPIAQPFDSNTFNVLNFLPATIARTSSPGKSVTIVFLPYQI